MKSPDKCRQGDGDGKERGGSFIEMCFTQAQSGDEKARYDLCAYVWKVAYRRALSLALPSVYDRQDFAQDVVIKLLEQLPQIRNLKHWLVRVFLGAQATAYRKYHQKHILSYEFISDKGDSSFELRQLACLEVSELLQGLDSLEREILYSRYIDGHSFAEIAKILDTTEGAVKTKFWRTKVSLQRLLASNSGEAHPHDSQSHRT